MSTQQELQTLKYVQMVVVCLSYLVSFLFLLHFYVFKKTQYKVIMSNHLVKLVMCLIFTGLITTIFGVPSGLSSIYSVCAATIAVSRIFATAEQLYSFMIALDLCVTSYNPLAKIKLEKYLNIVTHPCIWIISIVIGVLYGIFNYEPRSACVRQSPLLIQIADFFLIIVFMINMLLFVIFFINSRKLYGEADLKLISKKQEVILYILIFLTLGFLRTPLYIILIVTSDYIYLYICIILSNISSVLVPIIFDWEFWIVQ